MSKPVHALVLLAAAAVAAVSIARVSVAATPASNPTGSAAGAALPAWAPTSSALPANVEQLDAMGGLVQYRLKSNGLTLLLSPNHAAPVVTFMMVYHVGSRNEAPGNTGSAHLLEHLLFNKSTENFGRAKGHPTFQEVLYAAGADFRSTNMTTWNDRMTGYSTLPSNQLDLAMRIEADRMGRALILDSERQPEMSVVRNEYEIGENDPSTALWKAVIGAAIVAHPYHWDTIGYRSDIEGVSTDKLREHYRNYFWPDNSDAILVGDFDPVAALRLFDRTFGALPRSTTQIPAVITQEPPQEGERRVIVRRPGRVGIVQAGYMRPGALDPDFMVMDVLASLLANGVNSPLYRALVETGLASEVHASNYTFRDPYPIMFEAYVAPGHRHEEVEDAMKRVLATVATNGVTAVELDRAKSELEVAVMRGRDGTFNLASALAEAVASANWKWFVQYVDHVRAITTADVQRVASRYFVPDHATIGWFVPVDAAPAQASAETEAGGAGATPPTAGNAPPMRAAAATRATDATRSAAPVRSGSGAAARTVPSASFAERTHHEVLPNGIRLDIIENHAVPTVAIEALVLAGRMTADPGKPAVPFLTSEMIQRGTTKRSKNDIAASLDDAGASLDIRTDVYGTDAVASGLSRDTGTLLRVMSEELMQPAFADSELARVKSEFRNTVLRQADDTRQMAVDHLTQVTFPEGHPYRAPTSAEMLASIDQATLADLRAFHQQRYVGRSLVIAIAGDVDSKQVAGLVKSLFARLPAGTPPAFPQPRTSPAAPARDAITLRGKANTTLVYGEASGLRRNDPDYEAALIGNAALGQTALSSRIGRRVRDTEGLSYSLSSRFFMTDFLDGIWMVVVDVAPANLRKAMASTLDEVRKCATDGITGEEMETQKSFFAGNYQVNLGTNEGLASALTTAERFGYGPRYLDEFPARMRAVTLDQVNRAIHDHLHADHLTTVVAGDLDRVPD